MLKSYNIDRLTREDIFGGRVIAPMRQWLRIHNGESDTRKHDYNGEMAIITHYLQNRFSQEGALYEKDARPLLERYYRATHTDLPEDAEVDMKEAINLFDAVNEGALCQQYANNNAFTFVDLFAGIGGFRIALEQLGGRCVYASEFNTMAQKTYGLNHGVIPFGDIKQQKNKDLIPENVDVLCAGFPCQPFSMAGLRRGFSDETKGTLFFDLRDIIENKRPRIILLENVPGLMSIHDRDENGNRLEQRTIWTILDILRTDLHYHVPDPKILNACHFGVPQNRDRVFIVGFRDEELNGYEYPDGDGIEDVHFGAIRERNMVDSRYYMSNQYWQTLLAHREAQHAQGRGYGYCRINDDEFGHTLMVGGMGLERNLVRDENHEDLTRVNDPRGELNHDHIRVLTERECKLMQGFPEEFDENCVGKSSVYNQFGNSVAVPVVREVARTLLDHAAIPYENLI